ncbi:hypothetical protein [Rheinheimera sp. MMS21-TC3]|uniref:hypothetical protein n=1 Tax=Rheinheimera sp. MMS21-TC3 TaxID=3072790 RepID=UPI0028C388E5|nr:hypothetical protein [Rheinheimera sp. MMS21-TC3]WNO61086.1 hypothetical protein RDV63_09020 [Rheinheimera sp. MMS21-TC3]
MNIQDVITLLQHDLIAAIDFSPIIISDQVNGFGVYVWLKTPVKNKFAQIAFDTDRPFLQQSEVINTFHSAGVPKSRIHYVMPFGSCNYQTAEVL